MKHPLVLLCLGLPFALAACVITPDQPEATTEFRRGEIVDLSHAYDADAI